MVVGMVAMRACQFDPKAPMQGWGSSMRGTHVDLGGDVWTCTDTVLDGVSGVLLECRPQLYAGGTEVRQWFWRLDDLRKLGIASGGPRRL